MILPLPCFLSLSPPRCVHRRPAPPAESCQVASMISQQPNVPRLLALKAILKPPFSLVFPSRNGLKICHGLKHDTTGQSWRLRRRRTSPFAPCPRVSRSARPVDGSRGDFHPRHQLQAMYVRSRCSPVLLERPPQVADCPMRIKCKKDCSSTITMSGHTTAASSTRLLSSSRSSPCCRTSRRGPSSLRSCTSSLMC